MQKVSIFGFALAFLLSVLVIPLVSARAGEKEEKTPTPAATRVMTDQELDQFTGGSIGGIVIPPPNFGNATLPKSQAVSGGVAAILLVPWIDSKGKPTSFLFFSH